MAKEYDKSDARTRLGKFPHQGQLPFKTDEVTDKVSPVPPDNPTPPDPESPWQSLASAIYLMYEIAEAINPLPKDASSDEEAAYAARRQEVFDQQWAYCTQRLHACESQLPTTVEELNKCCGGNTRQ